MKARIIVSLVALTFLWSCSTTMKYTWTKENFEGKSFEKVLVLTISKNLKSRTLFENTVVDLLKEEGINATNALNVFTPVEKLDELSEDEIGNRIKSGGYDGVLITSLVEVNTKDVRVNNYNYYPYMYGGRYGYGYRSFIHYNYDFMYRDEYRQEKTYVLETRLYDVNESDAKEAIVWSGQSELVDPSGSESASNAYSKSLVRTLMESGTIKN
ncbi:hypothetical protein [uncultured Draconibacterium sp.]|uniref:hypothetical protein n=1 Tax=uncultured Draconibacterium sp. TaxID=1573823 RepID=UPI002AA948E6|nr:hypothetical protein [uncultured Draconibacterium sp.]